MPRTVQSTTRARNHAASAMVMATMEITRAKLARGATEETRGIRPPYPRPVCGAALIDGARQADSQAKPGLLDGLQQTRRSDLKAARKAQDRAQARVTTGALE